MYYGVEQLQTLREDYSEMFDSIILKLEARKIMYKTISTSAKAGKLVICGGAMVLGAVPIAFGGQIIKNATGLDPFSIYPMSGFSMLTIPAALTLEGFIAKQTYEKIDPFVEKINNRINELINSCDILINFFQKYKNYAKMDDISFQQLIFQFNQFYQQSIVKNKFVGFDIIEELMSDNEKYIGINESRDLEKGILQRWRNLYLSKILSKERKTLLEGFNKFYYDSVNLYNQSNFNRGSY